MHSKGGVLHVHGNKALLATRRHRRRKLRKPIGVASLSLERPCINAQRFLDAYKTWNLEQIVNFPTRFRNDESSLLDLVLVDDTNLVSDIQQYPMLGLSDNPKQTVAVKRRREGGLCENQQLPHKQLELTGS
ncbi:hypothetical protein HHI36_019263 [Cryptolaemus montrouzieri]|uniref:Uncharacterized protein n=1 Tax=Cryptolaemus montrouzieri TaxID=559131 RepID=A0ABD2P2I8_9CUCU